MNAYTPKDWTVGEDITETALDHIELGIKAVTDEATALAAVDVDLQAQIDAFTGHTVAASAYQELSANANLSGAGWQTLGANGITYLNLGAAAVGDRVNLSAVCRHTGTIPMAVDLRSGASTIIRRFTTTAAPTGNPSIVSVTGYSIADTIADLRVYVVFYTNGGSDTLYGLNANGYEQYTWLSAERLHPL